MGFEEVRTLRLKCDRCMRFHDEDIVTTQSQPDLPEGWTRVEGNRGKIGLTNYFTTEIQCPECQEKPMTISPVTDTRIGLE